MLRFKQQLVTVVMVIVWGVTVAILINATTVLGRVSILSSGVTINILLGIYYSFLRQRPASFREWLRM